MAVIAWPDVPALEDMEWASAYPLPEPGNMLRPGAAGLGLWMHQGTRMASQIEEVLRVHCRRHRAKDFAVLDFGCGNGRVALPLHFKRGLPTACADLDPVCIEYIGRALPDVEAQRPPQLPPTRFATASFDAIYAISVWTHLPPDTQMAWLDEMARLLKPGGIAAISTSGYAALASRRRRFADWADVDDETLRREGVVFKATGRPRGVAVTYGFTAHDPAWVREHFGDGFELLETREGAIENMQDLHILRRLEISRSTARALRGDLKAALGACAAGRGSADAVRSQIERLTRYASGDARATLTGARRKTQAMLRRHAPHAFRETGMPGVGWPALYDRVRDAPAAHEGVASADSTTTMATVLMEVLGKMAAKATKAHGRSNGKVKDCMVSSPVCAQDWQTLADIRRTMLVNDYSALPLGNGDAGGAWRTVRAEDLARFLRRRDAWSMALGDAINAADALALHEAPKVGEETPIDALFEDGGDSRLPAVVTRATGEKDELIGIVTAFDLL